MNEVEMGLIGLAWKHAQHAIDLGRKYGHGKTMSMGYRVLGDIYAYLLNFKKARHAYDQGIAAAGEHFIRSESLYRRGYCLTCDGDENGLVQITQAMESAENLGLGSILTMGGISELAALVELGNEAGFETRAQWFLAEAPPRIGAELPMCTVKRLRSKLFLRQGKPEEALQMLGNTAAWYHEHQYRWLELECLRIQATALTQTGQDATAQRNQIETILDELENGLEDAPILFEWQRFWEKYHQPGQNEAS